MAGEASGAIAPSENVFRSWLTVGALIVVPLLLFIVYYKIMFPGLINPSAMDLAQLGRNLSEGHGFTTYFLRPLALTHGVDAFRQPDVVNAPLFPVLLALAFGARGATDAVASQVSGLFYLLTVPALYLLGSRVFSRNVGLIAALIFSANPLMLEYASSGLPITLQTFLMTCLLLAVHGLVKGAVDGAGTAPVPISRAALAAAGLLAGGLYLTDAALVTVLPVIAVAVFSAARARGGPAIRAIGWFAGPLCLAILPWMIRTGHLTGNPIYGLRGMELWMGTKDAYPGSLAYRFAPDDLIPGIGLYNAVVKKMLLGAGEVVQAFPQVSASWMLAFLLPSLLFQFRIPSTNAVRRVMMSCFGAILVGMLPFGVDMPLFACLIPAMLVFAIAYLLRLVDQSQLSRAAVVRLSALLAGAVLLPLLRNTVLIDRPVAVTGRISALELKQASQSGDVVLTDQPWVAAWYADRPAIWIPSTDAKVSAYRKTFPTTRWLFLTDQVASFSPEWRTIYSVFFRWNQVYAEAKSTGTKAPGPIAISGTGYPLLESLHGFTVLEPVNGSSTGVVVAGLPRGN